MTTTPAATVTVDDLLANAAWAQRLARSLVRDGETVSPVEALRARGR
jgi:hypothetical protein